MVPRVPISDRTACIELQRRSALALTEDKQAGLIAERASARYTKLSSGIADVITALGFGWRPAARRWPLTPATVACQAVESPSALRVWAAWHPGCATALRGGDGLLPGRPGCHAASA